MANNENGDKPKFPALRSVPFTGNMTRDPKLVPGRDGNKGASFGLALNSRTFDGFEGEMFFDVILWGYWASSVLDNYGKGDRVTVIGDLYIDEWEGDPKYKIEAREISKVIYPERGGSRGGDSEEGGRSSSRRGRGGSSSSSDDEGESRSSSRRGRGSSTNDEAEVEAEPRSGRRSSRGAGNDEDEAEPRSSGRRSTRQTTERGASLD